MSTNYIGTVGTGPSLDNFTDGSLSDRWKPEVSEYMYQKYGDRYYTCYSVVSSFSKRQAVGNTIIKHQEMGWFSSPITTAGATGAGATGAPVTVTMAASALGVGNLVFPQLYNTGNLKNGFSYMITAVGGIGTTAPTFTLTPSAGGFIPAFASGEQIAVTGFASYEGAGQPTAYFQQNWEYQYALQYFKHTEALTGTAEMATPWATMDNMGVDQKGYMRLKIRGEQYMTTMISNEMMLAEGWETSVTGNGQQFKMQGWLPWIEANGGASTPVAPGAFTTALFDSVSDELDAVNAGATYTLFNGMTRQREITNVISSQYSSNAMVYVKPEEAGSYQSRFADALEDEESKKASLAVNIGIKSYSDSTRVFDFVPIKALSDPSTNNPTGYSNNYLSFIVPMNAVSRSKTEAPAPLVQICYLPQAKQKGFMDAWQGGANSEFGTNDLDNRYLYWKSTVGQRLAIPETWGLFYA